MTHTYIVTDGLGGRISVREADADRAARVRYDAIGFALWMRFKATGRRPRIAAGIFPLAVQHDPALCACGGRVAAVEEMYAP